MFYYDHHSHVTNSIFFDHITQKHRIPILPESKGTNPLHTIYIFKYYCTTSKINKPHAFPKQTLFLTQKQVNHSNKASGKPKALSVWYSQPTTHHPPPTTHIILIFKHFCTTSKTCKPQAFPKQTVFRIQKQVNHCKKRSGKPTASADIRFYHI